MALKVFLNQLGQDVIDFIENHGGSGGGGGSLEKDITSNVTVGAANAGTLFPQYTSFTEFAEKILRKDIVPSISFSASNAGLKEKGTIINGSTLAVSITNLKDVTVPINKIAFYKSNTLLQEVEYVEGQSNYTYNYSNKITEDATFKAVLTYSTSSKSEKSASFKFVYAAHYTTVSYAAMDDVNGTTVANSAPKRISDNRAFTWSNITLNDERFLYMYPASLGELASIKDGNGFSQVDSYTKYTINITSPADGKVIKYYAYLLTDAATGSGFTQIYN